VVERSTNLFCFLLKRTVRNMGKREERVIREKQYLVSLSPNESVFLAYTNVQNELDLLYVEYNSKCRKREEKTRNRQKKRKGKTMKVLTHCSEGLRRSYVAISLKRECFSSFRSVFAVLFHLFHCQRKGSL
jgi:hypothetical protein